MSEPVRICNCGAPENDHPYRHPFIPVSTEPTTDKFAVLRLDKNDDSNHLILDSEDFESKEKEGQ